MSAVLRVWRARATESGFAAYQRHFQTRVLPAIAGLPGFEGGWLARRTLGDAVEIMVETRWSSLDAIRAFAGEDIEAAVVEPEARDCLIDYEERVAHYGTVPPEGRSTIEVG